MSHAVDLAEVARRLMGDPTGRNGRSSEGRRLWWCCPFHDDRNPSFCVEVGKSRWRCFGCGAHGDAIELARKLRHLTFPQALAFVGGGAEAPGRSDRWRSSAVTKSVRVLKTLEVSQPFTTPDDEDRRKEVESLVRRAEARLWSREGKAALDYLWGRGLDEATIRVARIGWMTGLPGSRFRGIVIPWFSETGLELVKIRQPEGIEPRYGEVYRRRPKLYPPAPLASLPDSGALVVVEGEFDALLLGQALMSLATVITTGSASSRPDGEILHNLAFAHRVFLATDADAAGEACAKHWPARAIRVRPPAGKDWTEAHQAGIDLRRWWLPRFFGDVEGFEERAAIREYEAGLDRPTAERLTAEEFRETTPARGDETSER